MPTCWENVKKKLAVF